LNFGVYVFPKDFYKNPEEFVRTYGKDLVHHGKAKILQV